MLYVLVLKVGWNRIWMEGLAIKTTPIYLLLGLVALVPLNLGLELLKVKIALKDAEVSITNGKLMQSFWRGLSLRFILPNKVGLTASIAAGFPKNQLASGLFFLGLANVSQVFTTFLFGAISFVLVGQELVPANWNFSLILFAATAVLLGVGIGIPRLRKFLIKQWGKIRIKGFAILLGLSLLRFVVFTFQFVLALQYFAPELTLIQSLSGISLVFFIGTFLPGTFAGNIGAREGITIATFMALGYPISGLVPASLLIWFVNLFLPAAVGGLGYIFGYSTAK